jgi:uncharacterized cupin superfamily protein
MTVEEARLEQSEYGLAPTSDGWFVVNIRDGAWGTSDNFGAACIFEGDNVSFPQIGFTLHVLWPGQPNGLYHAESNQEDFLVLAGECLLLVEGEERRLKAWDFVHCPPGTDHIFVGAGSGPCVIFMAGARSDPHTLVYPRSELALRHRAGVERETNSAAEAYAPFSKWKPGRPERWDDLPWTPKPAA